MDNKDLSAPFVKKVISYPSLSAWWHFSLSDDNSQPAFSMLEFLHQCFQVLLHPPHLKEQRLLHYQILLPSSFQALGHNLTLTLTFSIIFIPSPFI